MMSDGLGLIFLFEPLKWELNNLLWIIGILQVISFAFTTNKIIILKQLIPKTGYTVIKKYFTDSELRIIDTNDIRRYIESNDYQFSEDKNEIPLIDIDKENNKNNFYKKILDTINRYILKNSGELVDYNVLKDIVERECDSVEEGVVQTVALPLYLGLMATMGGIIIGFVSISNLQSETEILTLLSSVKYAMIFSIVGLSLTVFNSGIHFRSAKSINRKSLNDFFNYLQSELLPVLPGIESIFHVFKKHLDSFNNEFGQNVGFFRESMKELYGNYETQKEILIKLNEIDIKKVSMANMEIFKSLNKHIDVFETFNDNIQKSANEFDRFDQYLKNINGFVEISKELTQLGIKVYSDFDKFGANVNEIANEVNERLGLAHKLLKFLDSHFGELEQRKDLIVNSISKLDSIIDQRFDELSTNTSESLSKFQNVIIDFDSGFIDEIKSRNEKLGESIISIDNAIEKSLSILVNNSSEYIENIQKLSEVERINLESALRERTEAVKSQMETFDSEIKNKLQSVLNLVTQELHKKSTEDNTEHNLVMETFMEQRNNLSALFDEMSKQVRESGDRLKETTLQKVEEFNNISTSSNFDISKLIENIVSTEDFNNYRTEIKNYFESLENNIISSPLQNNPQQLASTASKKRPYKEKSKQSRQEEIAKEKYEDELSLTVLQEKLTNRIIDLKIILDQKVKEINSDSFDKFSSNLVYHESFIKDSDKSKLKIIEHELNLIEHDINNLIFESKPIKRQKKRKSWFKKRS